MTLAAAIDCFQEPVCGLKSALSSQDPHTGAEVNALQDLLPSYLLTLVRALSVQFSDKTDIGRTDSGVEHHDVIEKCQVCCKFIVICSPIPVQVGATGRKCPPSLCHPSWGAAKTPLNFCVETRTCSVLCCSHHPTSSFSPCRDPGDALRNFLSCNDASSRLPSVGCDFAAHLVHVLNSPPTLWI